LICARAGKLAAGFFVWTIMIRIPLSQSGPADQFAKAVEAHRKALEAHMMGKPGKPVPIASPIIQAVIERRPQDGPVATRGPDKFVIVPYTIVDDTPVPAEVQLLRDSINQGA
jgi:hypothetical protein